MPTSSQSRPDTREECKQPPPPPSYPEDMSCSPQSSSTLDPWLGLRDRLFLSIISYGLVSLLFVGAQLLISSSQIDDEIQRTKDLLWSACRQTEQASTTLVSFPHLLASNFNSATKRNIDDAVQGLGKVLLLSITAIESLLVFLVDMYRSLFLCTLQFVIQACLSLLISAVQLFSGVVHDTAQSLQATIQGSIDALNATLSTTLGGMNDILKIIGQHITIPTIPRPDLSILNNVTLPSSLQDSLLQLNNTLPTLNDLKAKVDALIQTPFEDLKREVNTTITNFSFNQSTLPVPEMQAITYCNDTLDTSSLDDLGRDLRKVASTGIGLLVLFSLLFLFFNLFREWNNWKSLKRHVSNTKQAYLLSGDHEKGRNLLDDRTIFSLLSFSTHPLLAEWGLRAAERVGVRSTDGKTRVRWWLAWICHPVGIVLLVMGFVGVMSIEIQIAAVKGVGLHYQGRFEDNLDNSFQVLQGRLDDTLRNVSSDYATKSNVIILQAQNDLNDHLFQWINVTTSTMNNTLNEFMDGIATVINDTFSNTPLYSSIHTFIDCILGQKVAGIEKALSWLQSHAQITFSTVPNDVFMVSPNATQEMAKTIQNKALGSNGMLANLMERYLKTLEKERVIFLVFLFLYLVLFVTGTSIAILDCIHSKKEKSKEEYGNQKAWEDSSSRPGSVSLNHTTAGSGVGASHRSISKPLHPDVLSLYSQHLPYQTSSSPLSCSKGHQMDLKQPAALTSWESLLDLRNIDGIAKTSFIGRIPWTKAPSIDSTYSTRQGSSSVDSTTRDYRNSVQEWDADDTGMIKHGHNQWRVSTPLSNEPSKSDSSNDSTCQYIINSSLSSFDERQSDRSHLHPPLHLHKTTVSQTGVIRNAHLSDISERLEYDTNEDSNFNGSHQKQKPRLSFSKPVQGEEVRLHRNTLESVGRPGQAF